jgi:hypothetical protein
MKDFYADLSPEDLEAVKALEAKMRLAGPDHPSIRNPFSVFTPVTRGSKTPHLDESGEEPAESKSEPGNLSVLE